MIFDTHCHGYWNNLAARQEEVRQNMHSLGVTRSVHVGTSPETSATAVQLARDWGKETWCAAGLHPTGCQDIPQDSAQDLISQLEKLISQNRDKIVGVGETGFDYFHLTRDRRAQQKETQKLFFTMQADLALRLDLPLIIHTRDAAADTISLMKSCGVKRAVIHCYSEDPGFAQSLLDWSEDVYFSFSGILTYKKSIAVQDTARSVPLNRILVETDAPFLVPQIIRNSCKINEPGFTRHVMDFLKTLREEPGECVEQTVWDNSNTFFRV